jgi:PIN like domain
MPQSTSTTALPEPVFWVDENLGHDFVSLLRVNGLHVEYDVFPDGTEDVVWIPALAERGWVAITRDKLKADLEEQISIARFGTKVFVLIGSATHRELAEFFLRKLKWVKEQIATRDEAFLAKLYIAGGETKIVTLEDILSRSSRRWGKL